MPVELPKENIYQESDDTSFELYVNEFKKSGQEPTHLVFLIHGIGYKMFEETKFASNMFTLSNTTQEVLFSKYKDSGLRIFYMPISWAAEFHALTTVDGRMSKITLPTIPGMRVITNDCLSDVLYYFTDFHRQQLLDIICDKMNQAYSKFKEVYPEFKGHVGLFSHSLGGVISYDLLTVKNQEQGTSDCLYSVAFPRTNYPKLDFKPNFLFTTGSPIGAVMVMRGLKYEDFCLSDDIKFMNFFNPYDPLAYRIEPLIDPKYENLDPYVIEAFETKESSSYLPSITSFLPERMPLFKAARNMLANLNIVDSGAEQDDELSSECDSVFDLDLTESSINDLKVVDEDNFSTRRLSSFHATAVGISAFQRESVIERLHNITHRFKNEDPNINNNVIRSRPTSLYQSAIETFYPPKRSQAKKSSMKKKLLKSATLPNLSKAINKPKSTREIRSNENMRNKSVDSINFKCGGNSGNESDDERSVVATPTIPKSPTERKVANPMVRRQTEPVPPPSETWAYLTRSMLDVDNNDKVEWLLNGVGIIDEADLRKINKSPSFHHLSNNSNSYLDVDDSPKPMRKKLNRSVTTTDTHLTYPRHRSSTCPKLISKLTFNVDQFINVDIDTTQPKSTQSTTLGSPSTIPMLTKSGSTHSVPFVRHAGNNEFKDVLLMEEKNRKTLYEDAIYPPTSADTTDTTTSSSTNLPRYDYAIQASVMSNLSFEYLAGLSAHFCYWESRDVVNLMLKTMNAMISPPTPPPSPKLQQPPNSLKTNSYLEKDPSKTLRKVHSTPKINLKSEVKLDV